MGKTGRRLYWGTYNNLLSEFVCVYISNVASILNMSELDAIILARQGRLLMYSESMELFMHNGP